MGKRIGSGLGFALISLFAQSPLGRSSYSRKIYDNLSTTEKVIKNKPSKKRLKVKLARKQKHRK